MKFTELSIQTQRTAPSELRTEGLALLYRAGYLSRSGEPLPLGLTSLEKLQQAWQTLGQNGDDFFEELSMPIAFSEASGDFFAIYKDAPAEILHCPDCGYASQRDLALSDRQPFSREAPLPLEKILTPECGTIAQLAAFMQVPQQKTAKALMFTRLQDGKFVFVVLRGDLQLSEAKLKAAVGEVRLATAEEIRAAGAVPGYASPVGLRGAFIVTDELIVDSPNLVAGANEQGYHLKNTNIPRDYQPDLIVDLALSSPGDACPQCRTGTKKDGKIGSRLEALAADRVVEQGNLLSLKLLLALAELHHDTKGLTLPQLAAPFDVYLMNLPGKTRDTTAASLTLYEQLSAQGLHVLYDDRDERAGVKFADADLIGCPVRITVGERALENGLVEYKLRSLPKFGTSTGNAGTENQLIPIEDVRHYLAEL